MHVTPPPTLQTHVCKHLGPRFEENPPAAEYQVSLSKIPPQDWLGGAHRPLLPRHLPWRSSSLLLKHPKDEGPQTWLAYLVPPLPEASGGPLLPGCSPHQA